jgi:hypothetical protein
VGKSTFKKGSIPRVVAMPHSSCIHRALPPSGPLDGTRRCLLEGSASGAPPLVVSPPGSMCSSLPAQWCCQSCLLLAAVRGARPHGVHQPCGGEKRAGLRPPPTRPQLQGCSSSSLGWKASRVGVLPSTWAGGLLLPPAFRGEGRSPALRRGRTLATRGRPAAGAVNCSMPGSLA